MREMARAWLLAVVLICLVAVVAGCALSVEHSGEVDIPALQGAAPVPMATPLAGSGASNFSGLDVDTASGSTIVALDIDQHGTGDIIKISDGGSEVFSIADGGVATWSGGTIELAETLATTDTLTASECGKTVFLNAAGGFQVTLPAVSGVSAGCAFRFVVKTAPTTAYVLLTGNSDEDVLIGGINELEVDTGDDGPYDASADTITFVANTAVVGDFVYMISDGSFFYVSGQANADGGVTITDSD